MSRRPIIGTLEHRDQRSEDRWQRTTRRYSSPERAVSLSLAWLLSRGRVGSTVEIACTETGIQFAVARVAAGGKIVLSFTFTELEK